MEIRIYINCKSPDRLLSQAETMKFVLEKKRYTLAVELPMLNHMYGHWTLPLPAQLQEQLLTLLSNGTQVIQGMHQ